MLPQRVNPASLRGPVPLGRRPRDLVIKVKYGGTLKRFSASVNGSNLDHNLAALRLKIANAFKLSPDDELILTYTDEDGDIVMLDDDDDLRDAAVSQELNPLRIDVQLKSSSAGAPQPNQQVLNSRSKMSAAMEDQLAQVKSAIDEALKFVPEQVPAVLAKVSHELRSKAASSAPPVRELLDRIAKLMTPKSGMQPTSGLSDSSSGSSSGNPQTVKKDMRNNHASESATVSASHPQHANSSGALGLKSVLVEKTNAQVQQAPGCTSTGVPSVLVGSGGKLLYHKKRTDALSKGKSHAQSIGKPVISSSMPPVPSFAHGGSTLGSANGYMPFGSVGKINGDSSSAFPPPRGPPFSSILASETNPRLPSYCSVPTHGLQKAFPPPPAYDYNQFRFSRPSSVNPYGIYQDPYSFGSYSGYGIPQQSIHKWVECDGCGVTPIVGPRFKSTVKHNYDLCSACFYLMGNEAEYTRMDKPLSVSERLRNLNKSQDKRFLQLDCRFVKDLTVPDGTRMAPSTPFRKIWSMRNNGTIVWPYGTHLAWVGGDEFARQSSVKLAIPEAGFPIDGEIDVYVDFVSPTKPGRYISYWRLTSPDLQKFGQQVWVLIEVEQPVQASGDNQTAAIDLNLPADSNPTTSRPSIVQRRPLNFLSLPAEGSTAAWTTDSASDDDDDGLSPWDVLPTWGRKGSISPWDELPTWGRKGSKAVGSVVPPAPAAHEPVHVPQAEPVHVPIAYTQAEPVQVPIAYPKAADERVQASVAYSQAADEPVQVPVAYPHASSAEALGMPAGVPAPEAAPLMEPISTPEPLPAPILDNPLPDETINNNMEEKLLRELADMGFRQVDLNKEVLRQNEYDLQKSVDDLCGFHEWDPLLAELKELI